MRTYTSLIALILFFCTTLTLAGCGGSNEAETTADATGESASQSRTDRVENDYYIFERTVPRQAQAGEPYTIHIRIEAKRDLELVAFSEDEVPGIAVVSGQRQNFAQGLTAGAVFESEYEVQFASENANSTMVLTGAARVPVSEGEGRLALASPIEIIE